jgi:hypothetical protein
VFEDLPRNSHMRLSMLVRFDPTTYFPARVRFHHQLGLAVGLGLCPAAPGHRPRPYPCRDAGLGAPQHPQPG